ncbi:uncharacterized protein LACBIDRAFT_304130 [Laccaria bicolor S238N-H82]|uniref:Predicted protein n=1 Tax=Laccaria bicolor (strain S238N-H82 / ATCC MYA-4686) TaxID=486041 RepID=B0DL05_LACBS|nr:uncharacterized protein LACBIDRAFT_304130 [Laccaria bicolor S238N-H82]EDR04829.1 predicted protein [Laccaria bicolor S238N-H82]|eukprot:XP_001884653.1 predicted protein [Laccaria bicolor S238N-H82]
MALATLPSGSYSLNNASHEDELERNGIVVLAKDRFVVLAAQNVRLQHCSDMHQQRLSEGDSIRRKLDMIFKAAVESLTCPILLEPVKCLWILPECGHAFSAQALHQLFQEAVRLELNRDLHDHINVEPQLREEGHTPYTAEIFARFKNLATFNFTPSYKCPLCRTVVTSVPIRCTQTVNTALGIISFIRAYTQKVVTIENGCGLIGVDWADYFIFTI